MSHMRTAALVVAASTLAIAGCGSSGGTSNSANAGSGQQSKGLTSSELIAKADPICRRMNTDRHSITLSGPKSYVIMLPPLAAYERAALAELAKLTPPESKAADWHQMLNDISVLADDTQKIAENLKIVPNNLREQNSLAASAHTVGLQLTVTAKRDGFSDCAALTS